jgi:hypothetical protein
MTMNGFPPDGRFGGAPRKARLFAAAAVSFALGAASPVHAQSPAIRSGLGAA